MDSDIKDQQLMRYCVFYKDITSRLKNGDVVDAIYLDFSKAFDKVDYHIPLRKIKAHNITGQIFNPFKTEAVIIEKPVH